VLTYGTLPKKSGLKAYDREMSMAAFLSNNRQFKKKGKLRPERIKALESIPGL
jgi:hypothetical protein